MLKREYPTLAMLAVLCITTAATGQGPHYVFKNAGNFPGASLTVPFGISATHIVGYYESSSAAVFAYVQTGKAFVQAVPFSAASSYLFTINRSGLAVGGYCTSGCGSYHGEHAYTYDYSNAAFTSIDFPGAASTTGFGINDLGQIVGGYCTVSIVCPPGLFLPTDHGFLDDNGVFTTLDFPGAEATQASGINNAGVIVGIYDINLTGPHAYVYQNSSYTNIDYPGTNYTVASSINNFGVVAGLFEDRNFVVHGFLYFNGKFAQIDVPGAAATNLVGIDDRNDLVGVVLPALGSQPFKGIPVR